MYKYIHGGDLRMGSKASEEQPTDSSRPQEKPDHFLQYQSNLEQSSKPAAFSNHLQAAGRGQESRRKQALKIILEIQFSIIQNHNEIVN